MLKATLAFFAVVTVLLTAGFVYQADWVFLLLAAVNFLAGPVVIASWLVPLMRRLRSHGRLGTPD